MKVSAKSWVEISRGALENNVRQFRDHVGKKTSVMAVVKANAYGHGLVEVAKIADKAGVAWMGVDNVDEGIALRRAGVKKPILVLGYTLNERLRDCVAHGLSMTVYNLETAMALKALRLTSKKPARVHLKIDTGTTRQGVNGEALVTLAEALRKTTGVTIEGASTHFANIEDTTDHSYAQNQLQRFNEGLELLAGQGIEPAWKHAACSAATVLFPETYFNLVRLGISMYGLWSSKQTYVSANGGKRVLELKPVMTWKTVVAQVKHVAKGVPVGYGLSEHVSRDSVIAVVPVGYWDGLDRGLSSRGRALVRGMSARIIGRVCMNMCMIDVTDVTGVRVEDEVVLLGKQGREEVAADDMAEKLGTINYEVVTRINPMLPRIIIK